MQDQAMAQISDMMHSLGASTAQSNREIPQYYSRLEQTRLHRQHARLAFAQPPIASIDSWSICCLRRLLNFPVLCQLLARHHIKRTIVSPSSEAEPHLTIAPLILALLLDFDNPGSFGWLFLWRWRRSRPFGRGP